MNYHLLVISSNWTHSVWLKEITAAWSKFGQITAISENELQGEPHGVPYQLIVIDASAVAADLVDLVASLHQQYPNIPIVVTTTSPTWELARQIFLAGANDYIHRSLEMDKIMATFLDVIQRHGPHQKIDVE
jgi:DNA-binding NarL/FixJ family response regulator